MLKQIALVPAVAAARQQAISLSTITFRSIRLRYFSNFQTAQPLFAPTGGTVGTRYVLPNSPAAALYMAFDVDTAYREGNQKFYQSAKGAAGRGLVRTGGLRPESVVLIATHVRVSRLLNLCDPTIQSSLGINVTAELTAPWFLVPNAPTQILGDTVYQDGHFEGIIYPSAQNPRHRCLVLFPARLTPLSRIDFSDSLTQFAAQLP